MWSRGSGASTDGANSHVEPIGQTSTCVRAGRSLEPTSSDKHDAAHICPPRCQGADWHESAGHITRADGGRRFRIASNDGEEIRGQAASPRVVRGACARVRRQWRTVAPIAQAAGLDDAAADAAIALAVGLDWLLTEGQPPHSICLTEGGRVMVAKMKPR